MNEFLAFWLITMACSTVGFIIGLRIRRKHWFDTGYSCGYSDGYNDAAMHEERHKWRDRPTK